MGHGSMPASCVVMAVTDTLAGSPPRGKYPGCVAATGPQTHAERPALWLPSKVPLGSWLRRAWLCGGGEGKGSHHSYSLLRAAHCCLRSLSHGYHFPLTGDNTE